ncbi:hypothetical protein KKG58_05920 [Patescibacteria group bacterium]|nr:hypothetical protein [Patescibacteria group bacterium]
MSKQILLIIVAVAVAVGGGAFYGGMKYAESYCPAKAFSDSVLQNFSPEERQQKFQELGDSGALGERAVRGQFGSGVGGQSLSGEIISQSEDSLTIKLSDGSTKIVFVSNSTQVTKSVKGNLTDLSEGEQIFVGGSENSGGSYTAKTIQLQSDINNP